jgi:hypothetical protein
MAADTEERGRPRVAEHFAKHEGRAETSTDDRVSPTRRHEAIIDAAFWASLRRR